MLTPAARTLLTLCRVGAAPIDRLSSELADPARATALAELAQRHGLFGLALVSLDRAGLLPRLPEPVATEFVQALRLLRRQAAFWDLERNLVLSLLAEAGIPAVLLKGAALRLTAYEDPAERSFGDLDILVPEPALDDAVAVLTRSGYQSDTEQRSRLYREHHHHLILRKPMGFVVEVHWALEPARSPFRLDPAAFQAQALTVASEAGPPARVPCREHSILHLSTQNVEDGFSRLGRIVDLDRLVRCDPLLDWERLTRDAIAMRVNAVAALSLRLAEILLGTPLPAGWLDGLQLTRGSRINLALLDPVGLLVEQRSRRRDSLERLLRLWSIADAPTRRKVFRALHRGEQDWSPRFLGDVQARATTGTRALATLKLSLYQLSVYGSALVPGRGRRWRRFWAQA